MPRYLVADVSVSTRAMSYDESGYYGPGETQYHVTKSPNFQYDSSGRVIWPTYDYNFKADDGTIFHAFYILKDQYGNDYRRYDWGAIGVDVYQEGYSSNTSGSYTRNETHQYISPTVTFRYIDTGKSYSSNQVINETPAPVYNGQSTYISHVTDLMGVTHDTTQTGTNTGPNYISSYSVVLSQQATNHSNITIVNSANFLGISGNEEIIGGLLIAIGGAAIGIAGSPVVAIGVFAAGVGYVVDGTFFGGSLLDAIREYVGDEADRHHINGSASFKFEPIFKNSMNNFDKSFYNFSNPDVGQAKIDPSSHYDQYGWHEGRDPNAFFSTNGYVAANQDVAKAGLNPLNHYGAYGWKEGRDPSASFDVEQYLQHNPDVKAAGIDPLAHYLANGLAEGRQIYAAIGKSSSFNHGSFDAEYYLLANADVAKAALAAGGDSFAFAFNHYANNGWQEGRKADAYFDPTYYLAQNPDVAAAHLDPLAHYDNYGWKEGRNASADFNTAAYLAANPDVAAAHIDPLTHYLQFGVHEGRHLA